MAGFTTISTALEAVEKLVTDATAMRVAPGIITVQSVPSTAVTDMFSAEVQSRNTGKESDRVSIRIAHVLTLRFVSRIAPGRAGVDYRKALDREEKLIRAMMEQGAIPSIRTSWLSTDRVLTPSREQLISSVIFDLETYFPLNNTTTTPGN